MVIKVSQMLNLYVKHL